MPFTQLFCRFCKNQYWVLIDKAAPKCGSRIAQQRPTIKIFASVIMVITD